MPRRVKVFALNDQGPHPFFSLKSQDTWKHDSIDALRMVMHHADLKPISGDGGCVATTREQAAEMQKYLEIHAGYILIENVTRRVGV